AYEILSKKIQLKTEEEEPVIEKRKEKEAPSLIESVSSNPLMKQIGRTVARELTRGLLGVLGFKSNSRNKRGLF
ncbi:MAG: ATPase, partial [Bacteroidota bacterium]